MKSYVVCFLLILFYTIPMNGQDSADSAKSEPSTIQSPNLLDTLFLDTTTIEGKMKKKASKKPEPAKTTPTTPPQPDTTLTTLPDVLPNVLPVSTVRIRQNVYRTASTAFQQQDMEKSTQYYPLYFKLAAQDSIKDEDYHNYLIAQSEMGLPQDTDGQTYLKTDILPMLEKQMSKYPDNQNLMFAHAQINMLINKNTGLWDRKKYMKNAFNTLVHIMDTDPENKRAAIQLSHWYQELGVYPRFWLKIYGFKTQGYKEAVAVMEKIQKVYPNDCEVSLEMAIAYINSQNIPRAIMEFKHLNLLPEVTEKDQFYKTRAIPYVINLVY